MSRPLLLFLLGALCAIGALSTTEPDAEALLGRASGTMQRRIVELHDELVDFSAEQAQHMAREGPAKWMVSNASSMEDHQEHEGLSILAFEGDSLVAWSGGIPISIESVPGSTALHLRIGGSVLLHTEVSVGPWQVHGLRSVWTSPPVVNRYLTAGFHPTLAAPKGLRAEIITDQGPLIVDPEGAAMFRLAWSEGAIEMGEWLYGRMALLALAALLIITAAWIWCMRLVHTGRAPSATIIFLVFLVALRSVSLAYGSIAPFDRWPLFDPAIYGASAMFPSLGDLLVNALLLFVMSAFLVNAMRSFKARTSIAPVAVAAVAVVLYATWVTHLCIGLVNDSSIELDLYHVQGVGAYGLVALLSIALLMGSWALFSVFAIGYTLPALRKRGAAVIALIVLLVSIAVHHQQGTVDTILFLWPVPVIALLVWSHGHRFSFLRMVLVVGLLAATSTHILTKYMHHREQRERVVLAERLAAREDPVVEQLFREKAPLLRRDTAVYRLLTAPGVCTPGELDLLVRLPYFSGYWDRYNIRLYGYGPKGDVKCATDLDPPQPFGDGGVVFPSGVSDMPDLFIDEHSGGDILYHARIAVMAQDSSPPAQLIIEARPRSVSQGLGFPELLLAMDDGVARRAERYVRGRYVNGSLMDHSDRAPQPQNWTRGLDEEGECWYTEGNYDYLAKAVGSSTIMVLGLPDRGLFDKATTFSYIFSFFGFLTLLGLVFRSIATRSIPSLGIGAKVRSALVLFAITGLLFFGIGSQRLLSRQFAQRAVGASLEKARSVQRELQQRIGDERIAGDAHSAYLEQLCGQLGNTFFTDISVYAPDGRLLASSRPQMFSTGLLGQRMDPVAYARLALEGRSAFVHQERVGLAAFRTAYVPLLDSNGRVLGYIALPRFADQVQQEEERSELLVAVMNLFVLLFALSVLLAVFISNWTTRPLDLLKRSVANVALKGANEPIRYRGKDEVGELVAVYNRKVDELRESAERLAQSERESAWKEMARQVAHEIKNPLTPMKLGIQHFQRSWDPNAPDAREKLDRFGTSMVEQIDALSRVASDFSRFAQMSAAHETVLDLNDVARSSVALLAGEPNVDITLHSSSPLVVKADREHLLRVFNNLLKNALQAIPDGRRGKVDVVLRGENQQAIAEVRDNGTGVPEDARERIFEPNFTTKSSGMGLGLAMAKRMVEQAGGTIRFETRAGEGATFIITLPLHA